MDEASQLAMDAMGIVGQLSAILLILGGISFADVMIGFLIKLFKAARSKEMKW